MDVSAVMISILVVSLAILGVMWIALAEDKVATPGPRWAADNTATPAPEPGVRDETWTSETAPAASQPLSITSAPMLHPSTLGAVAPAAPPLTGPTTLPPAPAAAPPETPTLTQAVVPVPASPAAPPAPPVGPPRAPVPALPAPPVLLRPPRLETPRPIPHSETMRGPAVELEPAGAGHRMRSGVMLLVLSAVVGTILAGALTVLAVLAVLALEKAAG